MNQTDYLSQCCHILNNTITQLGFIATDDKICEISELIIEVMTQQSRYFHNFKHILMVSNPHYPLITLAGLFHDIVYWQVDNQIPFNLTPYITPFIEQKNNNLFIKKQLSDDDNCFYILLNIFGLSLGDNLSKFSGQNEFLSALVATKLLEPILSLSIITQVITLIELTIPFRHIDGEIRQITLLLEKRLEKVNNKFNLGLQDQDIINTITQAVKLANVDVSGFASTNVMEFINNTWLLLPETNHCLRETTKYTIQEYRIALANTLNFINYLSPQFIFHQYNNEPSERIFQELINKAEYNLSITRLYLTVKLVSISLLEAICMRFNPQISSSFLFGIRDNIKSQHLSLINFLPLLNFYAPTDKIEHDTLSLLELECQNNVKFSFKQAEFTTFILKYLTFSNIIIYQPKCYLFFEHKITNEEFLKLFPSPLITIISEAIAKLLSEKQKAVLKKL